MENQLEFYVLSKILKMGLKTINDVRQEPFKVQINDIIQKHNISDMDKVWDIGTVAVHPEYQNGGGSSSVLLYRAMYKSALENWN